MTTCVPLLGTQVIIFLWLQITILELYIDLNYAIFHHTERIVLSKSVLLQYSYSIAEFTLDKSSLTS